MRLFIISLFCLALLAFSSPFAQAEGIPRENTVTLLDLGADSCLPCKMMEPILEKLTAEYKEKADIIFIDVWKEPEVARKYGIRAIPTQIFYNKEGKEVHRHVGFLDEASIRTTLDKLLAE